MCNFFADFMYLCKIDDFLIFLIANHIKIFLSEETAKSSKAWQGTFILQY